MWISEPDLLHAPVGPLAPGISDVQPLIGLTLASEAFEFAVNRYNDTEVRRLDPAIVTLDR